MGEVKEVSTCMVVSGKGGAVLAGISVKGQGCHFATDSQNGDIITLSVMTRDFHPCGLHGLYTTKSKNPGCSGNEEHLSTEMSFIDLTITRRT
jgi:hypothetical protein